MVLNNIDMAFLLRQYSSFAGKIRVNVIVRVCMCCRFILKISREKANAAGF